ncbi:MAG: molybdenum cofactor biosynthesis protein MoaE [Cyclobacteriaceae bacterium]
MSEKKKPKKVFAEGAISPDKIANSIASHQSKTDIREHSIFLAQVKESLTDSGAIRALDFDANEEAVESILYNIREDAFAKFDLSCLHMYHSLGEVNVGEIYFFVFTSSPSKKIAGEACAYLVKEFETKVAISVKQVL